MAAGLGAQRSLKRIRDRVDRIAGDRVHDAERRRERLKRIPRGKARPVVIGAVIECFGAVRAQGICHIDRLHAGKRRIDCIDLRALVEYRRVGGQLLRQDAAGVRYDRRRHAHIRILRGEGKDGLLRLFQLCLIRLLRCLYQIIVRAEIHAADLPHAEQPPHGEAERQPPVAPGGLIVIPAFQLLAEGAVRERAPCDLRPLRQHAVLAVRECPILPKGQRASKQQADGEKRRKNTRPLRRAALQDSAAARHLLLLRRQPFFDIPHRLPPPF